MSNTKHLPARTHREIGGVKYVVETLIISTGKTQTMKSRSRWFAEQLVKAWEEVNDPHHPMFVENVTTLTEEELP